MKLFGILQTWSENHLFKKYKNVFFLMLLVYNFKEDTFPSQLVAKTDKNNFKSKTRTWKESKGW